MSNKKFTFQVLAIWAVLALALELFVMPVLAKPVSATAFQGPSYEAIDAYVQREMRRAAIPGLAYGIVFHDQIVHLQAFGIADPSGRLVTPQTPFIKGSVAKTFTCPGYFFHPLVLLDIKLISTDRGSILSIAIL